MNIHQYIASGIIESYVLGLATPEEATRFDQLLPSFPELKMALREFEFRLEAFAMDNQIPPPPGIKNRIQERLWELPAIRHVSRGSWTAGQKENEYIDIRESSTHIRVHKYWRAAFIALFIISKIFMILYIHFFLQYKLAEKEIRILQEQVKTYKAVLPD